MEEFIICKGRQGKFSLETDFWWFAECQHHPETRRDSSRNGPVRIWHVKFILFLSVCLRMPHPCRCSRPDWKEFWIAWSRGRYPCLWRGSWIIFKINYMSLWFYENRKKCSIIPKYFQNVAKKWISTLSEPLSALLAHPTAWCNGVQYFYTWCWLSCGSLQN